MGTFQGHALPGAFFVTFAIWWTIQITQRYIVCKQRNIPFYTTSSFACGRGVCARIPAEGTIKIVATLIGIIMEILAATDWGQAGKVIFIGDLQHATMYLFFCISGVVDVLEWKRVLPIPNLDYIAGAMAFTVEWLLFSLHLHGRDELDILVHTLLLRVIAACVVASLLEMAFRSSLLAVVMRTFFVFLQGVWFIQVGFILHNPIPGSRHWLVNHESMTLATLIFTWHCVTVAIAMVIIAVFTRKLHGRCGRPYTLAQYRILSGRHAEDYTTGSTSHNGSIGQDLLEKNDVTDYESEYELNQLDS